MVFLTVETWAWRLFSSPYLLFHLFLAQFHQLDWRKFSLSPPCYLRILNLKVGFRKKQAGSFLCPIRVTRLRNP